MRFSGTIVVVTILLFVLLLGAWYVNYTSEANVDGVADLQEAESRTIGIQEILSGDIKRNPKKNPELGKGRLRGMVRTSDGALAASATVQVTPVDQDANILDVKRPIPHYWEIETDKYGAFTFRTLRPGFYVVSASYERQQAVALAEVDESGVFEELALPLERSVALRGVVQNQLGEGVAGARVIPLSATERGGSIDAYRYTSVTTDESGTFIHPLLPEGTWDVLIVAEGFTPKRVTLSSTDQSLVKLGEGESLRGRLLREEDARPLNNTQVMLTAQDEGGEFYAMRTNGQGYFLFNGLRPTNYRLEVKADRHVASAELLVPPGESSVQELVVLAKAAASIRGRVLAIDGEFGVPEVRIDAFVAGESKPSAFAISDQAGYYQFKGLREQRYRLVASVAPPSDTILSGEADTVALVWGEQIAGPEFRVVRGETIRGAVIDTRGMGVGEANVLVQRTGVPGVPTVVTSDKEGRFSVSGIRDQQEITVWAEKLGQQSAAFGPAAVGTDGLEGILLRFVE